MPLTANYHTHTFRCRHAAGDCADYARHAVAAGMRTLGFADHTPLPDGRWSSVRMHLRELDAYQAAIARAASAQPELQVLTGMEVEVFPEYVGFYRDELLARRGFDYLIGSVHYANVRGHLTKLWLAPDGGAALASYVELAIATMASGLVAYFAHPDLFGVCESRWTPECAAAAHDLCAAAADLDVPLELNAAGVRKGLVPDHDRGGERWRYPWRPFWEVAAEYRVGVVIGSDAHSPEEVADDGGLEAWIDDLELEACDPLTGAWP